MTQRDFLLRQASPVANWSVDDCTLGRAVEHTWTLSPTPDIGDIFYSRSLGMRNVFFLAHYEKAFLLLEGRRQRGQTR